ncbi:hypothetical protein AB0I81_12500 [Nonomuraea sp. NPDC050404]|uniref:hypothetical protein n=1 Tax=Nonomuraea sp. NPDC050404 TaxID=3155783 RepID=UPI0033C29C48
MNLDQKGCGTGSRDAAQAGLPGLRGLRASVFAVVCVLSALAMHVLAGGPIAGLGTVVAATVVTGAGAYVLARRRRSPGTLLAVSFAAQYGMHQLFSSGPWTASSADGSTLSWAASSADGSTLSWTASSADGSTLSWTASSAAAQHHQLLDAAGHHGGGIHGWAGMLLAHVLVAAASAWWLDRGETALATMLRLLACSLHDLWALLTARDAPPPAPPARRLPVVVATGPAGVITSQVLAWALCRRGPPR